MPEVKCGTLHTRWPLSGGLAYAAPNHDRGEANSLVPEPPSVSVDAIFFSASRIVAQLVLVERDTEAGPGGQVDSEVRETERLFDQILHEDLRAEMLATPSELAQPGEDLQMRRGT